MQALTDSMINQPLTVLPFVRKTRSGINYWHVTPTDDYGTACAKGREYAAHLAEYLKHNPAHTAGVFGRVIAAMDHADQSPSKGYRVGFLSHWADLAVQRATEIEVFADLYMQSERYTTACEAQ